MNTKQDAKRAAAETILILGDKGKTGRRAAASQRAVGLPVRIDSRSASPSFHWNNEAGWDAYVADGVERALGRASKDFRDYAREVAAGGAWRPNDENRKDLS